MRRSLQGEEEEREQGRREVTRVGRCSSWGIDPFQQRSGRLLEVCPHPYQPTQSTNHPETQTPRNPDMVVIVVVMVMLVPSRNGPDQRVVEAVQIETQARVNQYPFPSHLPATAWPRQMLAVVDVTQHPLPMGVGRGDYDPPSAGTRDV